MTEVGRIGEPDGGDPGVVTVGESLGLLVAERSGRLADGAQLRMGFGGAESNVAIGVRRLGERAAWIGRVGADAVGDLIRRELRAEGVEVYASIDRDAATAVMLKERPRPGTSRITYYRRTMAGSRLQPEDVPAAVVSSARVLHITGISAALGPSPRAAAHAAIDHAKAAGRVVSFDVNHRRALWSNEDDARAAYLEFARRADIVFAGDDEAELLTGAAVPDAQLDALLAGGVGHAVVKLGARGAVAADSAGGRVAREAFEVDVVDTVGAGDCFVAGWLTAYLRGADPAERLTLAAACGAIASTTSGDWEAAPVPDDVAALRDGSGDPVAR